MTKERITKYEDRSLDIIHSQYKVKIDCKINGHNPRDLWNKYQNFTIHVIGVPEGEEKECDEEKHLKK